MGNLGVDNYGWSPAFTDYKQILEQLKSEDEMIVYEAIINLQQQLAVAQENTLTNFTIESYIPALIEIIRKPGMTDISNEINLYAVQCLTNLMDIFPSICNSIVSHGAVKALCDVMERSLGFIDLSEACIKAFDKISTENPYAILTSGALALCLNMMDFFESNTQKRILQLVLNASRHSASEQDFDNNFAPILPVLCMLITLRNENQQGSQEKLEIISSILLKLSESFLRFFSPNSQFDKCSSQFVKLQNCGVLEIISEALFEYSIMDQVKHSSSSPEKGQGQKSLSNSTVQNFLKLLALCSRYSFSVTKQLVDQNIFKIIDGFIPSQDDQKLKHYSADQFPFIIDSINLLDNLFPERDEALTSEADKHRASLEKEKKDLYQTVEQNKIAFVAEKILPKIFCVYENNMTQIIRMKTLQIIDKIISLINNELLNNFIEPYSFAKFIYSNFRSSSLSSIQISLEMVNKLMLSSAKTYTLPLLREGIVEFIKKINTEEGFEKTLGAQKTTAMLQSEKDAKFEEVEAMIAAKTNALKQQQEAATDPDQKLQYEASLQRYLEAARQHHQQFGAPLKNYSDQNKSIVSLSQNLCQQYFFNEQFMTMIKELCAEEFLLLDEMKILAQKIKEEAASIIYNEVKFKQLLEQLVQCLTNKRHVMSYEFKESGLLQALEYLLAHTPNQVAILIAQEQAQDKGEEMKRSEEMQINTSTGGAGQGKKTLKKKEARAYIQRLRLFTHFIFMNCNNKSVLAELVSLCHDLLSQSESEIFEISKDQQSAYSAQQAYGGGSLFGQGASADLNASVSALKQLTRKLKINLIYDPLRKNMQPLDMIQAQSSSKDTAIASKLGVATGLLGTDQTVKKLETQTFDNSSLMLDDMQQDMTHSLLKSKSHHPAFMQIGAAGQEIQDKQSKVFVKRNHLYTELKTVLLSVEQCASLWLLEDFLRNKIRSIDDVKALRTPTSFYESMQKTQRSSNARAVMEKTMEKLKEILSAGSSGRDRSDSEEYAVILADEILNSNDLSDDEQYDIIRQLELQSMTMMESLYSGEESPLGGEENSRGESFEERLLTREAARDRGGEEELEAEQRIYDFHRTIEKIKSIFKEKQLQKKKEAENKNISIKTMLEQSSLKAQAQMQQFMKADINKTQFQLEQQQKDLDQLMKNQQQEQLILMQEDNNDDEDEEEESKREEAAIQQQQLLKLQEKQMAATLEDIEMTDEEEEEKRHKKQEEIDKLQRYMKYSQSYAATTKQREFDLQAEEYSMQPTDTIGQDLEELIKANGDDIEYEFFYNGQVCNQNQTLFELLKQPSAYQQQKAKNYYSYLGSQAQAYLDQTTTIFFAIKERGDDFRQTLSGTVAGQNRKDSILDFNMKRQRALSEAVDDMSLSAVNTLVQQLIDKEFQVFSPSDKAIEKGDKKDAKSLEQSLKILKVLHFLCKHTNLISSQGMKFLISEISGQFEGQSLLHEQQGFTDYDLQISLSQIHPNMFHHHKLDLYIVKNIQDPYNIIGGGITDTLQQIFRNCPFLFPFQTRHLFFKLVSFIGAIDMNRSIYFLRQFLKQKGGKIGAEEKALKIQKQKILVDRTKVLKSAYNLMKQLNKRAFLEVEYKDEQGTGLGPTMEFYYIVADEIKNKKQEIWRKNMPDNGFFPAPLAFYSGSTISNDEVQKVYEIFRLAGTMMAKSIVDDRLMDLPLSSLFWDLLLGKKMNLFDLERLDKDMFKIFAELQQLANQKRLIDKQDQIDNESRQRHINALRTTSNARVEDLSLFFNLPGYENIELKQNGKNIEVTIENLQEYIDLMLNYVFHETVKIQLSAFKKGFNSIFSIESLKSFSTCDELEEMICGSDKNEEEWTNVQALSDNIVPAHGYHQKSSEYLNFLRFISELQKEEKRKFLKFVTGSPRLPNGGFAALDPKLTLVLKKPLNPLDNADSILPSVMTCQNYVKLPSYSSYEVLKGRFETAYNEGNNNFTLS